MIPALDGQGRKRASRGRLSLAPAALALLLLPARAAAGGSPFSAPPPAPPLPPPSGDVVHVSTVPQLQSAVAALASNTTILIAPGDYPLLQELRIRNGVTNVALRGATGNRGDVVIRGPGMATAGVNICIKCENAQDVLIANLSVGEAFWHPIQLQGEQGCDRVRIYNVRVFDAGQQFIKSTLDFANPNGVDDSIVEYSVLEYTGPGTSHGYTEGIDVHGGANWIIRYNLFRNIGVPAGAPDYNRPAVLMWSGSRNTTVHANTFIDCERGIIFGLGPQAGIANSHSGGVICDNFIYRTRATHADAGISVWDSPGTKVLHNTVIQNGTYPDAIEYRFPSTTGVIVRNNLTDGNIRARDGAQAIVEGNFTGATAAMFVNPAIGDLHLLPSAASAINLGVSMTECVDDWDGDIRPIQGIRDIGADEFDPGTPPAASDFFSVAPCRVADTRFADGPALAAGGTRTFPVAGRCGIPAGAIAAAVNVTVTQAGAPGYLRFHPDAGAAPPTSVVNYRPGKTRANNAIVALAAGGSVAVTCGQANGTVHFILDVVGYFR
jgi:hypothetical protein